jgi:hypothetical protein
MNGLTRRALVRAAVGLAVLPAGSVAFAARPTVEVWKSPDCGCCKDWVKHLNANGFDTRLHDTGNTDPRAELRMPVAFGSCPRPRWKAMPSRAMFRRARSTAC